MKSGQSASVLVEKEAVFPGLAGFIEQIQGGVLLGSLDLVQYSTDASIYQISPKMVVCPANNDDVQRTVKYAAELGLPITARGAGSGLAGESLTDGVMMDLSRYMTGIDRIDANAKTVQVQMGAVLTRLNDALALSDLQFGPDPSSGNCATIGGVLGNNATGAHSIVYGYSGDHVNWLDTVLADGTSARFYADGRIEGDQPSELREAIAREVPQLLVQWADRIEKHWPKTDRNRAGYNVRTSLLPDGKINWPKLLAGSEGTLAVFTRAELTLNDVPAHKGLLQINFDSMVAMSRALPGILADGCSACELMDRTVLAMARDANGGPHPNLPDVAASLVVEYTGASTDEVAAKLEAARKSMLGQPGMLGEPHTITDESEQADVWAVRKKAVPLLFRQRNAPQPVPFIEDVAVAVEHMPRYLEQLERILADEQAPVAYYAHAGAGELHIRPFLNLHEPADRAKMVRIARKTFELAWRCGGTVSGEHGCGLTRSGFLAEQYGEVYELFRLVKGTFDPAGRLNPGKIVTDAPVEDLMTTRLRYEHNVIDERLAGAELVWADGEMVGEIEACNGCGECRSYEERTSMCPVFRALNIEAASPRAKANLVRAILTGQLDELIRRDPSYRQVADYCINCKICVLECPSAVNIPKLMLEAKAHYVRHNGMRHVEAVLARGETMGKLGSRFGAVANIALKVPGANWIMEKLTGVDRRRPMPPFAFGTFARNARKLAASATAARTAAPVKKVCYFVDMFANYHDHSLGRAVMDVLAHNNIDVVVPRQASAAMPPIDYGDLNAARKVIRKNLEILAPLAAEGVEIVCSEPTAALCLKEEWLDVLRTPEGEAVAGQTRELTSWLLDLHRAGQLKTDFAALNLHVGYHAPCHLKALRVGTPSAELVRMIPGVRVDVIDRGCCGIAGTYGFQKRNYDTSLAIGQRMLDALRTGPAKYGMSECSTCKMQMDHVAGKFTFHPIKILAMAYGYNVKGAPRG